MQVQTFLSNVASGCCLALCYLHIVGVTEDIKKIELLWKAMDRGIIKKDGYVNDAGALLRLATNKSFNVIKPTDYNEDKPVIAKWEYTDDDNEHHEHFVIINGKDKKVIWNPLDYSNCVAKGKITSYRVVV